MIPLTRSFKELVQPHVKGDPAFVKELIASLIEAYQHAEGKLGPVRVHVPEEPNERASRGRLRRRQRPEKG